MNHVPKITIYKGFFDEHFYFKLLTFLYIAHITGASRLPALRPQWHCNSKTTACTVSFSQGESISESEYWASSEDLDIWLGRFVLSNVIKLLSRLHSNLCDGQSSIYEAYGWAQICTHTHTCTHSYFHSDNIHITHPCVPSFPAQRPVMKRKQEHEEIL